MKTVKLLLLALLFATLGPILVGGISGFLLADNSEQYPSRELAFEYYHSLLRSYPDLDSQRDQYRNVGVDGFAQKRLLRLECEKPLPIRELARAAAREGKEQTWPPLWKASVVDGSFSLATSTVLETEYEHAAIATLERSGTLTGLMDGCRQTVLFRACDALGKSVIESDLADAENELDEFKQSFASERQQTACEIIADYNDMYEEAYPQ